MLPNADCRQTHPARRRQPAGLQIVLKSFAKFIALNLLRLVGNPKRLRRLGEPIFWLAGFRRPAGPSRTPPTLPSSNWAGWGIGALLHPAGRIAARMAEVPDHLFVRESLVDLARLCPDVDEVIGVPVDEGSMLFDPSFRRISRLETAIRALACILSPAQALEEMF